MQLETRPEQMQALMPGITNNKFPLQTLAQEVEEEEGGARPEVLFYFHPFSDIFTAFFPLARLIRSYLTHESGVSRW